VTPLVDGMNLVDKEFVFAQYGERIACLCCRTSPAPPMISRRRLSSIHSNQTISPRPLSSRSPCRHQSARHGTLH
jgi:hypothetical protein